jgi:hypothetical protein
MSISFSWLSPRRLGLTFLLDEKSKQKNQDASNSLTARTVKRQKCTRSCFLPVANKVNIQVS